MGWEQLREIAKAQRKDAEAARQKPPVACPICGAVLDVGKGGVRNCPMGHYRTS